MAPKMLLTEQMKSEKQRFTWKMPHFRELIQSSDCIDLQKINFQMGASIGIPTNFTCFLKKAFTTLSGGVKGLTLSLKLAEPFPPAQLATTVNVNLALTILSNAGSTFYTDSTSQNLDFLLRGIESQFYVEFCDKILPEELLHPLDDSLSVNLTVTIFNLDAKPATQLNGALTSFKEKSLQKITQDLKTLYLDPGSWKDAPTVIVCKDGTELKVNRGILCVRSPVFRTMFQTEMSESDSGRVEIVEIPSKALDVSLHYVHTSELKDNWKEMGILEGLTYAAHKYEFRDLFEFLDLALDHLVNLENCGRLMNLAKTLGMEQAEKELMSYFKREVTSIEQAGKIIKEAESILDLYPKELEIGND